MSAQTTTLTGSAGEHYIMFRLLKLGYLAGLAPQGAPNADIIATDITGKKAVAIQVKTRLPKGRDNGWHMRDKHEKLIENNLYYCFVNLLDEAPIVYIIPSKIVAEVVSISHKIWLALPGRNGKKHKDNAMRRLLPDYAKALKTDNPFTRKYTEGWLPKYRENWEILGLG